MARAKKEKSRKGKGIVAAAVPTMMTYALDGEGRIVEIDDVPRGHACACTCLACGASLIARHGDVNAHHFAHAGDDCKESFRTYIRKLAVGFLMDSTSFQIPGFDIRGVPVIGEGGEIIIGDIPEPDNRKAVVVSQEAFRAKYIAERTVPQGMPCDAILMIQGKNGARHPLGIFVDTGDGHDTATLVAKAKAHGLSVVRIDMSGFLSGFVETVKDIRRYVLFTSARDFLYSRRADHVRATIARKAEDKAGAIVQGFLNRKLHPHRTVIESREQVSAMLTSAGEDIFLSSSPEAGARLAADPVWQSIFRCSPAAWQWVILSVLRSRFLRYHSPVSAVSVLFGLRRSALRSIWDGPFIRNSDLLDTSSIDISMFWHANGEAFIRRFAPEYRSPLHMIEDYLDSIVGRRIGHITISEATAGRDRNKRYDIAGEKKREEREWNGD